MGPRYVDTGSIASDETTLFGGELAAVFGPASVQAEYIYADVDSLAPGIGDMNFDGYYVMASFFLSSLFGDNDHHARKYDPKSGLFKGANMKAEDAFSFTDDGWGAWEVAARWSSIDLHDDEISRDSADQLNDITLGLNWYVNPNSRIMFNYVRAMVDRDDVDDDSDVFEMRYQFNF